MRGLVPEHPTSRPSAVRAGGEPACVHGGVLCPHRAAPCLVMEGGLQGLIFPGNLACYRWKDPQWSWTVWGGGFFNFFKDFASLCERDGVRESTHQVVEPVRGGACTAMTAMSIFFSFVFFLTGVSSCPVSGLFRIGL